MEFVESKEAVLQKLQVDAQTGLTSAEAQARLKQYGENKLKGKDKPSLVTLFFAQLKDMLIYVLLGAAVITLIIGEYIDAFIILLVVLLNAGIGVFQEHKAEKAIEALQKMTSPKTLVRRDGEIKEVDSSSLVPGDIVVLDAGRYIPADLRLLESVNLQIEESALTGESVPVEKNADIELEDVKTPIGDRVNMAFMSSLVTYGRGEGVVVATAMHTEMGKIADALSQEEKDMTPLQKRLESLGKTLGFLAIGICIFIFGVAMFQGRDVFEIFLMSISLAVAAIPEGLPAIVAIVLALGVTRMSKYNAIVKKLPAVETLGSVNIICSDKTGTLTQNKMTVVQTYTLNRLKSWAEKEAPVDMTADEKTLIQTLVLCSDATYNDGEATGDPTEVALVVLGESAGLSKKDLQHAYPRISERPFDSDRKMMSTLNNMNNMNIGYRVHTKGALDQLLDVCSSVMVKGEIVPLTEERKRTVLEAAEKMSNDALRVLGAAYKDVQTAIEPNDMEKDLILIGFVGMIDPPRLEVKDSIREAKMAGITPVMITGDHKTTAVAIAKQLDIADSESACMTGKEIDACSEQQFAEVIHKYKVFARVSPAHKVKIVNAFKAQGNIVSMTGDGVNDAPSLKNADIGVAMGITGTDVSKGASDMILTDDQFTTIVHAIREGRNIYNNIKKTVIFLLSCNFGEIMAILAAVLFFWPVPLLATQILWVNLITDTLPAIALGVDPGEKEIMKRKPRDPKESFFAKGAGWLAVLGGLLIGFTTLIAFYWGLHQHGYQLGEENIPEDVLSFARTMAFVVLAVSQLFYSLSIRSSTKLIVEIGLFTNKWLIGAIVIGIAVQIVIVTVPFLSAAFKLHNLSWGEWGMAILLALIPLITNEVLKLFLRKQDR